MRAASVDDMSTIVALVRALGRYERLEHEVVLDPETLRAHLFGARPYAEVLLAEEGGTVVGFALFFHNYSTFLGRPGIYLEDLFVKPEYRGRGHGKALLGEVARIAVERGCGRLEWSVLDWNEQAIALYRSLGAQATSDWTTYRISGETLSVLATTRTQSGD